MEDKYGKYSRLSAEALEGVPLRVAKELKRAREASGLSAYALAARMGMTYKNLYNMERGLGGLTLQNIAKYAKALDMEFSVSLQEKK